MKQKKNNNNNDDQPTEQGHPEREEPPDGPQEQPESVYNQTKYWLIENPADGSRSKLNKSFLNCIQTMNLRSNFLYWDAKSKDKQQQQKGKQRKQQSLQHQQSSVSIDKTTSAPSDD